MSWTVFDVMRMREYKLCQSVEVIVFHFERMYFAVLQQGFVLNFVKKFTKVQHDFFLDFNWK